MSEQPSNDPLGQFLGDLSAIRAKRNISLEALRNATKVYPNVIAQFEVDGLKDHPLFNSLYVRAFIRSYAKAVGIPPEEVLNAYDEALSGGYKRQLAIEHLDLPLEEVEALRQIQEQSKKSESVFSADKFEFDAPATQSPPKKKPAEKSSKKRSVAKKKTTERAVESDAAVTFIPKEKGNGRSQGMNLSLLEKAEQFLKPLFGSGKQSALVQWGIVAIGIVIGLVAILQLLSFQSSTQLEDLQSVSVEPPIDNEVNVVAPDSIAAMPAEDPVAAAPIVPVVLGDSIPIYVVAADGRLDPFRLKLDTDLRRPYWLDEGDSMLVYMKQRTTLEDNLENMDILIEGNSYPIYRTDSLATIIITRDSVQAFLQNN